jgi:hypothetical protein
MGTTGATSSTPNIYLVTLRPGTSPDQFVESQVYPTTNSRQLTTETFSSRGIEVSTVTTSAPTGTTSSTFTTPLLILSAPYRSGHAWTSIATSTTGQDTVKVMDRIERITNLTVAGRNLQVVEEQLHNVITDTTTRGTVTRDSTGTIDFSPLLGVVVSGHSQEVTTTPGHAPTTTNNQFQLQTIGSATPSGPSPGSSSTPLTLTCPPAVSLYASFRVNGTLTPAVAGTPVTILYALPDGNQVTHHTTTDSSGNYTDSIGTNQPGTWTIHATTAPNNQTPASRSPACTTSVN